MENKRDNEIKTQEKLEGLHLRLVDLRENHRKTLRKWVKSFFKRHAEKERVELKKEYSLEKIEIKSIKKEIKQIYLLAKLPKTTSSVFIARIYTKSAGWKDIKISLGEGGQFEYAGGLYDIETDKMEWLPKGKTLYRTSMYIEGNPNPLSFKEEKKKLEIEEHAGDRKIKSEMRAVLLSSIGKLIKETGALGGGTPKSISISIVLLSILLVFLLCFAGNNYLTTKKMIEGLEILTESIINITRTPLPTQPCCCPCCAISQFTDITKGCQLALTECQSGIGK